MNRRAMHLKTVATIVAVLAAGMAFGQGVAPKALAEAQKAAKEKELENSRAVLQDQLRRFTETKGTIAGRFAITQPAGSHFRASIEVRASDGRVEVDRVAFGVAGGWTHTEKTAEFKVQNVPVRPGVKYWVVVRAATCPLTHVFGPPRPGSDVRGYWEPQECKSTPLMGQGTDLSRIPVAFNKDNTSDVGEIAVEPVGAATAPATRAAAAVDPKTASLADALTDWIALLEKDDSKTATARWATNAAVGKVTAEWKALRERHKQHDYRRWIENSSDKPTTGLVPGGAKQIGKDTTFRVGGHSFGHLHIMWKKTGDGWRIAGILECN